MRARLLRAPDDTPRKLATLAAQLARRQREALALSSLCGCRVQVTRSGAFVIAGEDLRRLASVRDEADLT